MSRRFAISMTKGKVDSNGNETKALSVTLPGTYAATIDSTLTKAEVRSLAERLTWAADAMDRDDEQFYNAWSFSS